MFIGCDSRAPCNAGNRARPRVPALRLVAGPSALKPTLEAIGPSHCEAGARVGEQRGQSEAEAGSDRSDGDGAKPWVSDSGRGGSAKHLMVACCHHSQWGGRSTPLLALSGNARHAHLPAWVKGERSEATSLSRPRLPGPRCGAKATRFPRPAISLQLKLVAPE